MVGRRTSKSEWLYRGILCGWLWCPGNQKNARTPSSGRGSHPGSAPLKFGAEWNNRQAYGGHGSAHRVGARIQWPNTANSVCGLSARYTNSSSLNDPLVQFGETSPVAWLYAKVPEGATEPDIRSGVRYDRYLPTPVIGPLQHLEPHGRQARSWRWRRGKPNFSTYPTSAALARRRLVCGDFDGRSLSQRSLHAERELGSRVSVNLSPNPIVVVWYSAQATDRTSTSLPAIAALPSSTYRHGRSTVRTTLRRRCRIGGLCGPPVQNQASNFAVYSPLVNIKPAETREFNVSAEMPLYSSTTLTLSYVGTRVPNENFRTGAE